MVPAETRDERAYPYVTPIELPMEQPVAFTPETLGEAPRSEGAEEMTDSPFAETTILTEQQVEFTPDTAHFKSPEKANETLRPIAEYLLAHPEVRLLLAGSIAGDSGSAKGLPLERAQAVKAALCELGCAEEQLVATGLPPLLDPYHIRGVGYTGSLAQQNRHVLIMDMESQLAQALLSKQTD